VQLMDDAAGCGCLTSGCYTDGHVHHRGFSVTNRQIRHAKFAFGQIVRHRLFAFRGVIHDVDPEFANSQAWYEAIPKEIRPAKDQPFYHLFAVGEAGPYEAYVSEQNLLPDPESGPVTHPMIERVFGRLDGDRYVAKALRPN
jgi:heat shock protein HspQ